MQVMEVELQKVPGKVLLSVPVQGALELYMNSGKVITVGTKYPSDQTEKENEVKREWGEESKECGSIAVASYKFGDATLIFYRQSDDLRIASRVSVKTPAGPLKISKDIETILSTCYMSREETPTNARHISAWKDRLFCLSGKHLLIFNDRMRLIKTYPVEDPVGFPYLCASSAYVYFATDDGKRIMIMGNDLCSMEGLVSSTDYLLTSPIVYNGVLYFLGQRHFPKEKYEKHGLYMIKESAIKLEPTENKPVLIKEYEDARALSIIQDGLVCLTFATLDIFSLNGQHLRSVAIRRGWRNACSSGNYLIAIADSDSTIVNWYYSYKTHRPFLPLSIKRCIKEFLCLLRYKLHHLSKPPLEILELVFEYLCRY